MAGPPEPPPPIWIRPGFPSSPASSVNLTIPIIPLNPPPPPQKLDAVVRQISAAVETRVKH